ncbi:hypothetical protein [Jannaschia rubra]|uniref:hypothetical protein n=1 Tax=Jannaschia rubra TaxID=282197 RepID=UPI002491F291|nr:hypothetical protein [Jannaschia rubra]
MDIAIHLGAHCTDEDLILRTLGANADLLRNRSVFIPPGGRARPAIRKALQGSGDLVAGGDALLSELLGERTADRMVLSYEGFLGVYAKVLSGTSMYIEAGQRAQMLRDLFPGHRVEFLMAIRNPATFVPALFEASSISDFGDFLSGHDLTQITWAEPVEAIREACPEVPLTLWCNEDLPLIWPEVLRTVSGIDEPLKGEDAILRQIMSEDGLRRLRAYLNDNPPDTPANWRKVVTAYLGKYAEDARIEPDIDLPGWSDETIEGLTDIYEQDVVRLKARDDIIFIAP